MPRAVSPADVEQPWKPPHSTSYFGTRLPGEGVEALLIHVFFKGDGLKPTWARATGRCHRALPAAMSPCQAGGGTDTPGCPHAPTCVAPGLVFGTKILLALFFVPSNSSILQEGGLTLWRFAGCGVPLRLARGSLTQSCSVCVLASPAWRKLKTILCFSPPLPRPFFLPLASSCQL